MPNNPRFLVVHCTGRTNSTVATIRHTHVVQNRWSDIGYHSIIYKDGSVHAGRPENRVGAHTGNYARPGSPVIAGLTMGRKGNIDSLGVVLVGNFDLEVPSRPQIEALMWRLAYWCRDYGIDSNHIFGHRDFLTHKSCPGENLYRLLPSIRAKIGAPAEHRVYAWKPA